MSQKFYGTISELFDAVNSIGVPGRWFFDGAGMHTFRSASGGVINWWQTTKTIQFQGKSNAESILRKSLKKRLTGKRV